MRVKLSRNVTDLVVEAEIADKISPGKPDLQTVRGRSHWGLDVTVWVDSEITGPPGISFVNGSSPTEWTAIFTLDATFGGWPPWQSDGRDVTHQPASCQKQLKHRVEVTGKAMIAGETQNLDRGTLQTGC